jgi:DNA-directed RNA polymerase sigma subunit (sigma70/sigma32)
MLINQAAIARAARIRKAQIILLRKKHWTMEQIAEKFAISRQRVHQILSKK